jgi:hypothetical protein
MQTMLFQHSASDDVPGFPQVLSALGTIPAILYRALEFGTAQNRAYFETLSENEPPRLHVREMIVRDMAKRFLERSEFVVEEDRLMVGSEPLVALVLRWNGIQIRILKGKNGVLPGCGRSVNRKRFYRQLPSTYLDDAKRPKRSKLNVVLLWDFDAVFNLKKLWLVCPRTAGARAHDVTWFWHESIPHPAISAASTAGARPIDSGADLEDLLRDDESTDRETKKA